MLQCIKLLATEIQLLGNKAKQGFLSSKENFQVLDILNGIYIILI